jgi:uncharacterized protein
MRIGCRRAGATGALVVGLTGAALWTAAAAAAHVTVVAPGATAGDTDATIVFRVPDESDTASTVGLKLRLPTDTPIAGVLVAPQPGWTARVTRSKLSKPIQTDDGAITDVVSEVVWTADPGAGINPGFFGEFTIIGGKLPTGATTLTFKAIQSYSDGEQVAWIDQVDDGSGSEPEHPAPVLHLAAASSAPAGSNSAPATSPAGSSAAPTVVATPAHPASRSSDNGRATAGVVLGGAGVALGAAALLLALRRVRSPRAAVRDGA